MAEYSRKSTVAGRNSPPSSPGSSNYDPSVEWKEDNQAWWDWYVTLAEDDDAPPAKRYCKSLLSKPKGLFEDIRSELNEPYGIRSDQISFFQANGYIKIKNFLSEELVTHLRAEMVAQFRKEYPEYSEDSETAFRKFIGLDLVWLTSQIIRDFVLSKRVARACADLLSCESIRLYHDNLLSKEPNCGRTPWHYDAHHFPLKTQNVVSVWIPAQQIPIEMGPLAYAYPIDTYKSVKDIEFDANNTSYDAAINAAFRAQQTKIDYDAFDIGEVGFHHTLNFHSAGANSTDVSRIVLTNTYYEDGAHITDQPGLISGDWRRFFPGAEPSMLAATEMNPICWSNDWA
jgi:ectoine hydroxylase-related dioxygenase (phytanoyl-CoA dioxygenase family)